MRARRAFALVGTTRLVDHHGLARRYLAQGLEESRPVLETLDVDDHRAGVGVIGVEAQILVELDVAFIADADEGAEAGMAILLALGEKVQGHVARLAERAER